MRKTILLVLFALLAIGAAFGQVTIQAGQTVSQSFDAVGTAATATLPTGWKADKNATVRLVGSYSSAVTATERNGGDAMISSAGNGIYNFGAGPATTATDRAIGFLSSGSATKSGNVYLQLTNNGSTSITSFSISYNVEKYRMGTNVAGFAIQMYYSTDGTTWTSAGTGFLSTMTADASNDGYSSAPGATVNVSGSLGQSLAASSSLYLAWNYSVASGTTTSYAQALGVDDISIQALGAAPTPTISVVGTLNAFSTFTGTPSVAQSYTLSGSNLTTNIAVAALAGYEYSTDNTNWSSTLSLASTYNGLVYVRLTGATAGSYNGDIVHSSTGATSVNLAASGTVTAPTPTITLGGTLNPFATTVGSPSAAQSYTVAGVYLTGDINIGAVAGFEYSLSSGSGYAGTLALTPTGGTVATTTIYVRLAGTTAGDYSGNIAHTSTGATQQDKAVTGSVLAPIVPETFFEDNFEYTAATLLTANGWTAHSGGGTNSFTVASSGLSYAGYPANSGLAAQTTGTSGEDVNRTFTAQTSGAIYASLLANLSSAHANGDYFFHLAASPVSSDFKGRIFAQTNVSNQVRFGVSRGGANTTAVWTDYVYALDTTYLLVLKYQIVAGATNDVVSLWVNPTIGPSEPAANCISTDVSAADAANIGGVALRQGNTTAPTPAAKYDGIRIANTWAQLWTVPIIPLIEVSESSLSGFSYEFGIGPSTEQTFTVSGANLTTDISISASTNYEISKTSGSGYTSPLIFTQSDGLVSTQTVYVRLKSGLSIGSYVNEVIVATSLGATTQNIICDGSVTSPPPPASPTANSATAISHEGFSARFAPVSTATSYRIDVLAGGVYVSGWNNKAINNTIVRVDGLSPNTGYTYRVRAVNDYGTSSNSNVIEVTTGAISAGAGANTSISGASTIILVEPLDGFTDNTVEIDPDTSTSDDITVSVAANELAIQYTIVASDAALSGLFWLNHAGLGFTPVNCTVNDGTIVEWSSTANETFVEIADFGAKGTLIITLEDEETLPVELSSFSAVLNAQNNINILWVTQTETGLAGYYILRGVTEDFVNAELISPMIEPTNTSQQQHYVYTDQSVSEPGTYYYWLQVSEMDGNNVLHGPTTVNFTGQEGPGTPGIDLITGLHSVYPNPFNPSTTIGYGIAKAAEVTFSIYNARGQVVRTINQGMKQPNNYKLSWNGLDDNGVECSTGIYFIRMQAGKDSFTRKAMLMK